MSENRRESANEGAFLADAMVSIDTDARAEMRGRVMGRISSEGFRRRARTASRRATSSLMLTVMLFGSLGVATASSLPGDMLYPIKLAAEQAHVAVTPAARRSDVLVNVTGDRLDEIDWIIENDERQRLDAAVESFGEAVERAVGEQETPQKSEEVRTRIINRVSKEDAPVQAAVGEVVSEPDDPGIDESPGTGIGVTDPQVGANPDPGEAPAQEVEQTWEQEANGTADPPRAQSQKP